MTLEAKGIGRRINQHWLLRDVSLVIKPGDRLGLVGPSGSGKTLLLRSLALLDPVKAGVIRYQGETPTGHDVPHFRSRVIYLPQRPPQGEGTVEEHLREPFALRVHRDKQFNRDRIVAWLELLGRDATLLSKVHRELSGGEMQFTALLRALQLNPHILLLDEPTAAIDGAAARSVEALLIAWLDDQPAAHAWLWVTHDDDQAQRVSTSVLQIRDGALHGEPYGYVH